MLKEKIGRIGQKAAEIRERMNPGPDSPAYKPSSTINHGFDSPSDPDYVEMLGSETLKVLHGGVKKST